jgi:RNA polymerase sigma-70 factor (ECF subfamily)
VKDFDAAKEIVQDAFISLWEKRETIDVSRPVKSYLTTVIHHKCQNYLRDTGKFNTDLLGVEGLLETPAVEFSDNLVAAELAEAIRIATEELPDKCREIFLLKRNENLRYKEIADLLKLSPKTVEAQMSKALQHFRLRLAEYLVDFLLLLALVTEWWKCGNGW